MVDALVSGASAARRVGSTPILGTQIPFNSLSFRGFLFIEYKRTQAEWGCFGEGTEKVLQ